MTVRQHQVLVILPVLGFFMLGALVVRSLNAIRDADRAVTHTQKVIRLADSMFTRMLDAETGQRGFVLMGSEDYLEPYVGAEQDFFNNLRELRRLTTDNPMQTARLDTLSSVAQRRFDVLNERVRLRRTVGFNEAVTFMPRKGKALMDSARLIVHHIEQTEQVQLNSRISGKDKDLAFLQWASILGILITAAVTLVLHRIMGNYARQQESARVQLEEANRAKAEFLTAMSHELRTPLNAVIGYNDLVVSGVHGPVNERQVQSLERVRVSAQYLLTLITDVLSFARIDAGKLALTPRSMKVDTILTNVDTFMRPSAEARDIELTIENEMDGARVIADNDRLQQIMLNLVGNAVKFTDPGGRIRVSAHRRDQHAVFRVVDNGCGMPADQMEKIFDPFVQLRRDPSHGSQAGVGLGLAISRELARAMGGDINVQSEPGRGSEFELALPLES